MGNQNVQISGVAEGASIRVTFAGSTRKVPLEPAVVPVGGRVRSPARLMRARSGVLPFVSRPGLMDGADGWMAGDEPFHAYLVGGRGGSGKTRLGMELARRAQ